MLPPWEALSKAISITQQYPTRGNILNLVIGSRDGHCLPSAGMAAYASELSNPDGHLVRCGVRISHRPRNAVHGLPRHLLLAFPIFIGSAPVLERFKSPIAAIGHVRKLALTFFYVLHAWVP